MEIRRHILQGHAEGNKFMGAGGAIDESFAVPGQASTLVLDIQQISITKRVAAYMRDSLQLQHWQSHLLLENCPTSWQVLICALGLIETLGFL